MIYINAPTTVDGERYNPVSICAENINDYI
jgi:hypothetical protein